MVFDFTKTELLKPQLPPGFWFVPWSKELIDVHGGVLHRSFQNDLDGQVFHTFQNLKRCIDLIAMVAQNSTFLQETSLLTATSTVSGVPEYIATIQGLKISNEVGAVQNVGVIGNYRLKGIGKNLVLAALHGFRRAGVVKVTLEATADNLPAMRLYEGIGFTTFNTYFREMFD